MMSSPKATGNDPYPNGRWSRRGWNVDNSLESLLLHGRTSLLPEQYLDNPFSIPRPGRLPRDGWEDNDALPPIMTAHDGSNDCATRDQGLLSILEDALGVLQEGDLTRKHDCFRDDTIVGSGNYRTRHFDSVPTRHSDDKGNNTEKQ